MRDARLDEPAVLELVARLQGWYVGLYGGEDTDPIDADDFAPPRGAFVVVEADGAPIAMGGFTLIAHDGGTAAKLRRMFAVPERQREGLATRVLDALEDRARAAGARSVVLETGAPQVAAVAFYRARGYVDVPAFGFYADSPQSVHLGRRLG